MRYINNIWLKPHEQVQSLCKLTLQWWAALSQKQKCLFGFFPQAVLCKTSHWTLLILPSVLSCRLWARPGLSIHRTHLQFAPVSKTKTWRENNNPKLHNFTERQGQDGTVFGALCCILNHWGGFIISGSFPGAAAAPSGSRQCQVIICDSEPPPLKTARLTPPVNTEQHAGAGPSVWVKRFNVFWQWS